MRKIKGILCCFFICSSLYGQDPQFSQAYANQLYLNPAFTGNTRINRVSFTYRNQWAAIENGYNTYIASFDHYKDKLNSGFGLYFIHDRTGLNGYKVNGLNFSYSYNIKLNAWSGFRAGLGMAYNFLSYDKEKLIFTDQLIQGTSTSIEESIIGKGSYSDFSTGLIYYSSYFWLGFSLLHITQPNISIQNEEDILPMKISIHGGITIWTRKNDFGKELQSLNLVAHYKNQGNYNQFDVGLYYNFKPIILGLWYRGMPYVSDLINQDAVIILIGIEHKDYLRLAYSYDISINNLGLSTGGSHELSLIYEWQVKKKKNFARLINCPKF